MGAFQLYFKLVFVAVLVLGIFGNNNSIVPYAPRSSWTSVFGNFPFSPLAMVQILNDKCDSGTGRYGTCMAKIECTRKGGEYNGICGQGFGVCCVLVAKENFVAHGNNTLLYRAPFNSGAYLTYTVLRMSDDICQFRLDVKKLYLYDVQDDGHCFHDYMLIDQDSKFKKVCGLSRDIHYYIDVDDSYAIFTFQVDPNMDMDREWEIYVSQYTCDMGAPEGCGQWYWGQSGTINIWNNVDPADTHWYYIEDQDYAICIRWEAGYCSVTYSETLFFRPKCDDLFERPGKPPKIETCTSFPPAGVISYTSYAGLQYFYVEFEDSTNSHVGSSSNPFKTPNIAYSQNKC